MIALKEQLPNFTPTEYLAWEEQQELRHEYVGGEIYAMTGGTVNHSEIAINLSTIIKTHLRGTGCRVLSSDAKVQVLESNSFLYPDLSVTCHPEDRTANKFISHPGLIIEILSPSTEAYDRGEKFKLYRRSTSLQEYVLVSTQEIYAEVYHRNERDCWELKSYEAGDAVELKSINCTIPLAQVYEDIVFQPET